MKRSKDNPYWNQRVREERKIAGLAPTLTNQRGLKGSTLGPANDGRKLSYEEKQEVIAQMKRDGKL